MCVSLAVRLVFRSPRDTCIISHTTIDANLPKNCNLPAFLLAFLLVVKYKFCDKWGYFLRIFLGRRHFFAKLVFINTALKYPLPYYQHYPKIIQSTKLKNSSFKHQKQKLKSKLKIYSRLNMVIDLILIFPLLKMWIFNKLHTIELTFPNNSGHKKNSIFWVFKKIEF